MWKETYKSKQGNIGLGRAIAYYSSIGVSISIPLNDTQKYDLIIDNESLKRVSIKTTSFKHNNFFRVELKNSGGGSKNSIIRNFDNKSCDILFILTIEGTMYEIPSNLITTKSTISLTNLYDKYIVKFY